MTSDAHAEMVDRIRQAGDLYEAGLEIMEQNLRRAHPEADDATIARLLQAWLEERPGAEFGDAVGRPLTGDAMRL